MISVWLMLSNNIVKRVSMRYETTYFWLIDAEYECIQSKQMPHSQYYLLCSSTVTKNFNFQWVRRTNGYTDRKT